MVKITKVLEKHPQKIVKYALNIFLVVSTAPFFIVIVIKFNMNVY